MCKGPKVQACLVYQEAIVTESKGEVVGAEGKWGPTMDSLRTLVASWLGWKKLHSSQKWSPGLFLLLLFHQLFSDSLRAPAGTGLSAPHAAGMS